MNTHRRAMDLVVDVFRGVLPQGVFWRLFGKLIEWEAGRRLHRLTSLSHLRLNTVAELPGSETQACVDRCRAATSRIRTYRARLEARQAYDSEGDPSPVAVVTWDAIVVRPDRLHVLQIAGDDCDEWITVGDATWGTVALALGCSDPVGVHSVRSPVNQRLRISRYMPLLAVSAPTLSQIFRFRGQPMTYLGWEALPPEVFERHKTLDHDLLGEGQVRHVSMYAWIWEDGRLARFDLALTDDNDDVIELSHTFAMYDYPFQIAEPRAGGGS